MFKLAKGDKAQRNQVEAVKTRFTTLLQDHQVVEKEFRKKVKDRAERQYKIVNPTATEAEIREAVESDNPAVFSQALLNSNRYGAARGAMREVQDRHVEIQKIERTLAELAQMFNEMAMLVEQQDETIVAVETQAMGVDQDIQGGLDQTNKAVVSARKARRKKWICFWIIGQSDCIRNARWYTDDSPHYLYHCACRWSQMRPRKLLSRGRSNGQLLGRGFALEIRFVSLS